MTRAAVIGAGSWGTAFAQVLVDSGTDTILCARRAAMEASRQRCGMFRGQIPLPLRFY